MSVKQTFAVLLASTIVLSACGGGGGTEAPNANSPSSGGTPAADQSWLTFSPSPAKVDAVQGKSTAFTIAAHASKAFTRILISVFLKIAA